MAIVYKTFLPEGAQFAATIFPQYQRALGTNFSVTGLAYDATTAQNAYWKFNAETYGSGNLTLELYWYAATATTGSVVWLSQLAVINPNVDTQDVETKAFATANSVTQAHLGTTAKRIHRATITLSNLDTIAAKKQVWLKVGRDAANASDDMAGNAILVQACLSYSDV